MKMIIDFEYGGLSKNNLLKELNSSGILLNQYAETILSNRLFRVTKKRQQITLVTATVEKLGFSQGATMEQIIQTLKRFGLSECPIEVAPYLRLHLKKQREIKKETKNQAPFGSLTIFSKPLMKDDEFPKGFYLRKYQGKLWLRGYRCSLDHCFAPKDKLIFKLNNV